MQIVARHAIPSTRCLSLHNLEWEEEDGGIGLDGLTTVPTPSASSTDYNPSAAPWPVQTNTTHSESEREGRVPPPASISRASISRAPISRASFSSSAPRRPFRSGRNTRRYRAPKRQRQRYALPPFDGRRRAKKRAARGG